MLDRLQQPEFVAFEGSVHTVTTGEVSPTSVDATTHLNGQGLQGVGLVTGARYEVPANERIDLELSLSPPTVDETFAIKSRLIRQGSLDNLWLRTTFRLTFPPFQQFDGDGTTAGGRRGETSLYQGKVILNKVAGEDLSITLGRQEFSFGNGLIIGNEAHGVGGELRGAALDISIPTVGVESLNAANAAGILLYEARRQRMLET